MLGCGFDDFFVFNPYLGQIIQLDLYFQMGLKSPPSKWVFFLKDMDHLWVGEFGPEKRPQEPNDV